MIRYAIHMAVEMLEGGAIVERRWRTGKRYAVYWLRTPDWRDERRITHETFKRLLRTPGLVKVGRDRWTL